MDLTAEHRDSPITEAGHSPVPAVSGLAGLPCPLCGERVSQATQAADDLQVLRPCGCVV